MRWVEVNSLGDKILLVDTDCCFIVVASEYYVNAFKLADGRLITERIDSSSSSHHKLVSKCFSVPFLIY